MTAVDTDMFRLPLSLAAASGGRIDAIQIDLLGGINTVWGGIFDYSRDHWASASMPLSFDPSTSMVAEPLAFPDYVLLRHLSSAAHSNGLLVSCNNGVEGIRAGGYFGSDLCDYFALEGPVRSTPASPLTSDGMHWDDAAGFTFDQYLLLKRAMAGQRPVSTLYPARLTVTDWSARLNQDLFYGAYTGFEGGSGDFYTPAVRALFKKYVPLVRMLSAAGWQPVQYALSSNPSLWIERYGSLAGGDLYLTVRNETDVPQSATITLFPEPDGGSFAGRSAEEEVSGLTVPLTVSGDIAALPISLAPHRTAMLRI